jgi:hypothetical protein
MFPFYPYCIILLVGEKGARLLCECNVLEGNVRKGMELKLNLNSVEQEGVEDDTKVLFSTKTKRRKSYIHLVQAGIVDLLRKPMLLATIWNSDSCFVSSLSSMYKRILTIIRLVFFEGVGFLFLYFALLTIA